MILKETRNNLSRSDTCFLLSTDKTDYIGETDEEDRYSIAHSDPFLCLAVTRLRFHNYRRTFYRAISATFQTKLQRSIFRELHYTNLSINFMMCTNLF